MSSTTRTLAAGALAVGAAALAACADSTAPTASTAPSAAASSALLSNAFTSAAPGYEQLSSSYAAAGQTGTWAPERSDDRGRDGGRGKDALGDGGFMGGGMAEDFLGGPFGGFGRRGPFGGGLSDSTCTFAAGTGRVTCAAVTRNGLTYQRSAAYTTAAGAAQAAFDSLTTNTVNVRTSVSGTTTFTPRKREGFGEGFGRDSVGAGARIASATSDVQSASDRTVSGLAAGSTQRTVTSTSSGRESTVGVRTDSVKFTTVRIMGDTTTGLVVPVRTSASTSPVYPTAGTVVRAMSATVTFSGQAPVTSTRREVLTYDGSATAKLVITRDGTTKNCTVALPRGRPSCA